jgi:RNA polymerase sigma-70 factor (ECF subfamily)
MSFASEEHCQEAFRKILAHRTMLKAYVQAIVRDPILAEDTFSDVTLEIVRVWSNYDKTRDFAPWARGLARRVALTTLRKQGRYPVALDDTLLDQIGEELGAMGDEVELEARKQALERCLESLSTGNRELVQLRYFETRSYLEIAQQIGRSVGALYVRFNRIHQALEKCIEKGLKSA